MPATKVKGLPDSVDAQSRYKEAMSRPDAAEWAESYNKEYMGIKQHGVFEVVSIEKGMKLNGHT